MTTLDFDTRALATPRLPNEPVALVSGGASGIGAAISRALGQLGAAIGVLDIATEATEESCELLRGEGIRALAMAGDVRDAAAVQEAAEALQDTFGAPPNIVVHNAGWTGPNVPFLETTADDQRRIIDVNFVGGLSMVRGTLPAMQQRGGGTYILVSSDAARIGTPKEAIYSGAKAGLVGFAKALAVEVARDGITVNVVSPGSTDTPLIRRTLSEEQIERRVRANPMRRLGQPEDVAGAAVYLASTAASYLTGQVISINGGMTRVD